MTLVSATAVALAAISAALALEHLGGFEPCPLCLEQRTPYYIGIPLLAVLAAAQPDRVWDGWRTPALALVAVLLFSKGAWLGAYQAGAEWGLWDGPASCAAGVIGKGLAGADLLAAVKGTAHVSCTVPALRVLGVSLAGWNALSSGTVAALSAAAATAAARARIAT